MSKAKMPLDRMSDEAWELRVCGPVAGSDREAVASWAADVLGEWVAGWDCVPAPAAVVVATPPTAPAGLIGEELGNLGPCTMLVGSGAEEAFELARLLALADDGFAVTSTGPDGLVDDGPVLVVVLDPTQRADAAPDARAWELAAALV